MSKGLTLDPGELREKWMRLYMNICILRSTNPACEKRIREVAEKLMYLNEELMPFFDYLEGVDPEGS